MSIASDSFRTVTVKIHDISQQLPYIVVNQADDDGKIIRFVPLDHGQKVTGFTGARLYYPPRSGDPYGDYVTGVESDGAWDFTIPVGVLSVGRVVCNLSFIDGGGETYSRNVVFLVEQAVSGVFDPEDGQQTRIDKIIGTVQDTADTAIQSINETARDAVESIGKAEESISESVTQARGSADAAANSGKQAAASASAAQTSERNASNSATQASQSATAAKQSEDNAAASERNAASSAEQAANIVASVSGSVAQAENAAQSASQSSTAAADSASTAGGSAQAAADSASKAGESATAAGLSERNAASSATQAAQSATAAAQSATAAAQSATAAQQAVDGFGMEVGTTTTGEPGTDAAVEIQKNGTKYTANFTIPRGDVGPAGVNENVPLGTASGIVAQATDAYPALPRKVRVHGRTIENLWATYDQATNDGVTLDTDDTGLITVTGNASTDTEVTFYRTIEANPGDTFTVVASVDTDNTTSKLKIQCANQNGSYFAVDAKTTPKTFSIPEGNSGLSLYIRIPYDTSRPAGVRYRFYVTLVRGPEAPVAFVPNGVNTVKPTKLLAAGKNFLQYTSININKSEGKFTLNSEENQPIALHVGDNTLNYEGAYVAVINRVLPPGEYVLSYGKTLIQGLQFITVFSDGYQWKIAAGEAQNSKKFTLAEYKTVSAMYIQVYKTAIGDYILYPMIESGSTLTDWEPYKNIEELNLPSDINLSDGDTLAIDRDGTTRILHTDGEPTVLENVTLPELPAPTFNVHTVGGYVPPTVGVNYEQDVNLVLQALEAKIAALQVADKTN